MRLAPSYSYHVRIVIMRVRELLCISSFCKCSLIVVVFVPQRMRSINPRVSSDCSAPTKTSSSENVVTQADRVITTCSTRINEVRFRLIFSRPRSMVWSCKSTVLIVSTVDLTLCISLGAFLLLEISVLSAEDICLAAARRPITAIDTLRGSILRALWRSSYRDRYPEVGGDRHASASK
jgi:hypothetical protein